jgi:hypothetical protein
MDEEDLLRLSREAKGKQGSIDGATVKKLAKGLGEDEMDGVAKKALKDMNKTVEASSDGSGSNDDSSEKGSDDDSSAKGSDEDSSNDDSDDSSEESKPAAKPRGDGW